MTKDEVLSVFNAVGIQGKVYFNSPSVKVKPPCAIIETTDVEAISASDSVYTLRKTDNITFMIPVVNLTQTDTLFDSFHKIVFNNIPGVTFVSEYTKEGIIHLIYEKESLT